VTSPPPPPASKEPAAPKAGNSGDLYVSIRQHTSAYTSAYVSIRQEKQETLVIWDACCHACIRRIRIRIRMHIWDACMHAVHACMLCMHIWDACMHAMHAYAAYAYAYAMHAYAAYAYAYACISGTHACMLCIKRETLVIYTSAYFSIRQHIRQHTSAYVSKSGKHW
jgi:hypothetical protein